MVDEEPDFTQASDASTLLSTYAEHIAGMRHPDPFELGALRERFREASTALPRRPADARPDLTTSKGWYTAFVAGAVSRGELEAALPSLAQDPAYGQLQALIPHYAAWIRARYDKVVAKDLLRLVVKAMQPGAEPAAVRPSRDMRLAALRARRSHPVLASLAPALFGSVLEPSYKTAESAAARGVRAARPSRRRERVSSGRGDGMPWWTWFFLVWAVLGITRRCNEPKRKVPEVPSFYRDYKERRDRLRDDPDALRKRIEELLRERREEGR